MHGGEDRFYPRAPPPSVVEAPPNHRRTATPRLLSPLLQILAGFVVGAMVGIKPIKGFVADAMATWALKSPAFHNFSHATDTLTIMTRLLHPNYCDAQRFLYPPEAWALGLAAIGHDLAHPGLDNAHQVRWRQRYEDGWRTRMGGVSWGRMRM